jgi:outer membrane receptor protein involved in Fe transport
VSYVTRHASLDKPGATASGEVSDTQHGEANYTFRGSVDAPLIKDVLGLRVSGFYDKAGGFINDAVTGQKDVNSAARYGGRTDLTFRPNENLTFDLWGAVQKTDRDGEDFIVTDSAGKPTNGALQYNQYIVPSRSQDFKILHGKMDYETSLGTLTYIGSYQDTSTSINTNYSNGPLAGTLAYLGSIGLAPAFPAPLVASLDYQVNFKKDTQELRFASKPTGPLTWIVGAYYTYEDGTQAQDVVGRTTSKAAVATLDPALHVALKSDYEEYAAFGNVTYAVTPKLDLTGGVRIGRDDQTYQQFVSGSSVAGLNVLLSTVYGPAAAFAPQTVPANSSEDIDTYLAEAKYKFTNNAQAYFRFATGYRPGGPNVKTLGTPPTFASDSVNSYEVGFKGQTPDRRARIELAVFDIEWSSIQVAGSAGGIAYETNGGSATSRGVEASASWIPLRGLTLGGTFAYTDAYLNDAIPAVGGAKGDRLPQTPRVTGSFTADYEWPLTGRVSGVLGAVVHGASNQNTNFPANPGSPNIRLDGYVLADLRAGVRFGKAEISAFIRNIADDRAELSGRNVFGLNEVELQRPRTIGVLASVRY